MQARTWELNKQMLNGASSVKMTYTSGKSSLTLWFPEVGRWPVNHLLQPCKENRTPRKTKQAISSKL